jgi:hypothetical protein
MDRRTLELRRDSAREHARTRGWDAVFDALFADYEAASGREATPRTDGIRMLSA